MVAFALFGITVNVVSFEVNFGRSASASATLRAIRSPRATSSFILRAKKKSGAAKASGGGTPAVKATVGTTSAKGKKGDIRVRLNMDVKNVGRKGEVVFVSGAMFNNVLGPQKKASRVSDEENAQNIEKALENAAAAVEAAKQLKDKIEAMTGDVIERNIGPDGSLFGVVAAKHVLEHLKDSKVELPVKATVKEMCEVDDSGAVVETCGGVETKKKGSYIARIQLNEKVDPATFAFSVQQKAK